MKSETSLIFFNTLDTNILIIKPTPTNKAETRKCNKPFSPPTQVVVIEPPSSIKLSLHTGKHLDITLPADEGSSLHLSCVVNGGRPRPRVWWTLKNESHEVILDESWEPLNKELTKNDLMLPHLNHELHQDRLVCHASNTNISLPLTASVTLLLNMAPRLVRITGIPSTLLAGDRYRVWCEALGSRPAPTLTWTIRRPHRLEEVLATQDLSQRNVSRGRQELEISWSDHGATLSCSAASPALPSRIVTNTTVFDVHFAPRLHLTLGRMLKAEAIEEKKDVYFRCSVTANPKVYKITWYHNDEIVQHDRSAGVLVSDDHLVLQKVHRRWSGTFVCRASNVVGDATSNALSITVRYAPLCSSSTTGVYRVALGDEITLPCRVLAHPPNVTFSWTFMNSLTEHERVAGERVTWKGLESRLRYLPEKTQDYGTLHCWASNVAGNQKEPCVFTVKPAGVPSPPLNCTVSNQTWESVEVTCGDVTSVYGSRPGQGHSGATGHGGGAGGHGLVLSPTPSDPAELVQDADKPRYLVTVHERLSKAVTHNFSGDVGMFVVSGLTPGIDYLITVVRFNSHGRSAPITLEAFTLRTAENRMREKDEGGDSAVLGVAAGVVGAVLVLVVVAVIITLRSRRPRSSTPTKSTHLPSGEASEDVVGLDHPDLLEAKAHVGQPAPYRAAEVTQALLSQSRPLEEDALTPASVSPTAHIEYLPCEGSDSISPTVRPHPRLYVRAEGHSSQQESFL
ncbi:hemicentin-1-like [Penaeus chinensis]|uniref:hemicentin-1-like n=1 Tax=Penaeus chinensis TaxID=139456 RepID=UPI001FB6517F|nr:hemicentin-1-like [Penaeus chinensis]